MTACLYLFFLFMCATPYVLKIFIPHFFSKKSGINIFNTYGVAHMKDRKIIKTGKLEDLSEEELENKMKQILDDYSQIIDVTPDPKKIEGDKKD